MISSHLSTLCKLTSINTFGRSVDLKHFVRQHNDALDNVIKDIKYKLCEDIQHIEDVLDNATDEITKKVPLTLSKIYHEFVGQIESKVQDLVSLPYDIDYMLKLNIDKIRAKLEITYENDVKGIEKNIQYLIEKMPIIFNRIFYNSRVRGASIYRLIRPGKSFTQEEFEKIRKIEGLGTLEKEKTIENVRGIIQGLKFLQRHTRETRNSMNRIIQEMHYYDYNSMGSKTFRYYIQKLKNNLSYYEKLEGRIRSMMESWDVLKKILDQKDIRKFLTVDLESFIEVFQGGEGKESVIADRVKQIKDSIEEAIKKLRALSRYDSFLDSLRREVDRFGSVIFSKRPLNQPQDLIENIVNIKRAYDEVIRELKKGYISDIRTNLGISDVSNWDGKLFSLSSGINFRSNSELKTQPYINQLKAIQKIQAHLEKIKKKKEELSSSKSNIGGITNVESGIAQLKEIQRIIEAFISITGSINSLESTYHFEVRTMLEIPGEVKGLMSVISDTVKSKSHIKSYIEFLEKIKEYSRTIEYYWSRKDNLPSIGKIIHELGSCLFYTHHCNYNGYY